MTPHSATWLCKLRCFRAILLIHNHLRHRNTILQKDDLFTLGHSFQEHLEIGFRFGDRVDRFHDHILSQPSGAPVPVMK